MSTDPDKQESSVAPTEADGTGVFMPPPGSVADATEVLRGTGEWAPASKADATEDMHGTGEWAPASEAETGLFPGSEAGATGEFIPPTPGSRPGTEGNETLNAPSAAPRDGEAAGPTPPYCGRYVLKRFHARGGMGEIWLANDPMIGRSVALKRMLRPSAATRFADSWSSAGHRPARAPGHRADPRAGNEREGPAVLHHEVRPRPDASEGHQGVSPGGVGLPAPAKWNRFACSTSWCRCVRRWLTRTAGALSTAT